MIQVYDPGGSDNDTTVTTTNENNFNKLLQRDTPTNISHITDNTVSIPKRFANRLLSVLQKSIPNATLHRNMCKIKTIKLPESKKNVPDILFDTEASHSSYTSKSWVDDCRKELCAY